MRAGGAGWDLGRLLASYLLADGWWALKGHLSADWLTPPTFSQLPRLWSSSVFNTSLASAYWAWCGGGGIAQQGVISAALEILLTIALSRPAVFHYGKVWQYDALKRNACKFFGGSWEVTWGKLRGLDQVSKATLPFLFFQLDISECRYCASVYTESWIPTFSELLLFL